MDREGALAGAGITASEEAVYLALLRTPAAPVAEIARATGMSPAAVRRDLGSLESNGLVVRAAQRTLLYNPIPPDVAIGALIRKRHADLDVVRRNSVLLMDEFRRGGGRSLHELVEIISGLEAVSRLVPQLQDAAEREMVVLSTPPYMSGPVDDPVAARLLGRGVQVKVVYDRSALEVPGLVEAVERDVALGEEARVVDELPVKALIIDRRTGIVPLTTRHGEPASGAVLVHPSPLLDALLYVFDALWRSAAPFVMREGSRTGEDAGDEQRTLVALLFAGFSDQAIASRLGVSSRTIRRRILELMRSHGVKTRFQLAAVLSAKGWI